jgi:hypothetical protein
MAVKPAKRRARAQGEFMSEEVPSAARAFAEWLDRYAQEHRLRVAELDWHFKVIQAKAREFGFEFTRDGSLIEKPH